MRLTELVRLIDKEAALRAAIDAAIKEADNRASVVDGVGSDDA